MLISAVNIDAAILFIYIYVLFPSYDSPAMFIMLVIFPKDKNYQLDIYIDLDAAVSPRFCLPSVQDSNGTSVSHLVPQLML